MHHRHHGRHGRHHGAHHGDPARRFARSQRGHDFHHGPHHHGGGRGGLGRFFAHGDLRLVVLHLLAEKPRHGYEVIKAIEERVGGAYSPSPGVIYPTLTLLEELGQAQVAPGAEGGRKLYAITPEGEAALQAERPALAPLLARMDAARQAGGEPPPQVLRAMENLKLALRLRFARGRPTEAEAQAIAAALDAAALAVERS